MKLAPIPSLLATAGVHHHLVREGTRNRAALVIETGEAREVHHLALLIGYGAGAVNPYLAFETLDDMIRSGMLPGLTHEKAVKSYIKALNKGVLKVMSKMGISTLQSYRGAQIFEAVGLEKDFVDRYFTWTASRIGGAASTPSPKRCAPGTCSRSPSVRLPIAISTRAAMPSGGATVIPPVQSRHGLQAAACDAQRPVQDLQGIHPGGERTDSQARDAARAVRAEARGQTDSARRSRAGREILRRFATGAMSYGSISQEARDAGDRDEPPRRQIEHRRGRRRSARASRTQTAILAEAQSSRSRRRGSA